MGALKSQTAAPRVLVAEVTDARTRRAHLVTERAFTAGCRIGRFAAVCGAEVLAASLATPDAAGRPLLEPPGLPPLHEQHRWPYKPYQHLPQPGPWRVLWGHLLGPVVVELSVAGRVLRPGCAFRERGPSSR